MFCKARYPHGQRAFLIYGTHFLSLSFLNVDSIKQKNFPPPRQPSRPAEGHHPKNKQYRRVKV